ncbi:E3 ubiquitin-protein ligase UBR2-like isoform X2 [Oppia nitens]|uniref:E3 ubiquitin-protein ligase UBR2-like isoform X2 n=1 Tax=Oppia nitens TaxID=1686743 RepID=UPI0023DBA203|nr:E3 ubiquitin-protein ligase UBR2-like isoform X2 [Oppia nitens]
MCDNELISSSMTHICDEFSQQWLKRHESRVLAVKDFRQHWAQTVPKLYSPAIDSDCLNIQFNEIEAKNQLIAPLERFMTGVRTPQTIFSRLNKTDDPPTLCGRIFKAGEPTYSCCDCGLDPLCVLCVDCFRNSNHKNHRYKMSTSSGGSGFCDCGDKEAWKSNPFCDIHNQSNNLMDNEMNDPLKKIPPELSDIIDRTRLVFKAVLCYCFEILTWNQNLDLPEDLINREEDTIAEKDDTHVTMLFNDEIHTYEQVINTLSRAIDCLPKEATEYATIIDREGRSIVKCSTLQVCNQVKVNIEKITSRHGSKPVRVDVMHTSIVAHQTFATRLLSWLHEIINYCEAFRCILVEVLMSKDVYISEGITSPDSPLLELIMCADTQLWKFMRNQWHQLFISGLLMDSRSKKEFAKVFIRNYGHLMNDFILDDHDHSISITSLSLQLFTVPSLAQTLIAEENVIVVLLKTFLNECGRHRNHDGKLAFERNQSAITTFRRSHYILFDLKYILSAKPSEWTDDLRKNFLLGLNTLVDMLKWMQGMDAVVRQVGQHVEFEAEWETGVNLQLRLAPIVGLVIEWCSSDRSTLIKALRYTLKELAEFISSCPSNEWELCGYHANCLDYDVSSLPVTIHLPFSRLVAGLLLQLGKYDLNYNERNFIVDKKPTPIQLIELPLRTQVMIAQFRAGMWRRNGYSLVNQVYFYHSVKLRDEMYDRDILMLQIGAARCEPNEYLIHILNKFNLLFWSQDNYESVNRKPEEDFVRQTISLVEEFLGLILIIISERFVPGVGKVKHDDRIKKEIIQWLSMSPMTHSELVKYLLSKETTPYNCSIEDIIKEVAIFKRPTTPTTGKYELKPEYYKDFNTFFYHYSRQDQSCAEESQMKRKKQNGEELICCPPPIPPDFAPQFSSISYVIDCDVMLHLIEAVLKRTCNLHAISFSETQFEKVLHIIGVGLHEEAKGSVPNFMFSKKCIDKGIYQLLEECLNRPIVSRIDIHKDLLKWTLKRFNEVLQIKKAEFVAKDQRDKEIGDKSENLSKGKIDRQKSAEMAAKRRDRIMAQMTAMQKNFIAEHKDFFNDCQPSVSNSNSLMDLTYEPPVIESIAVGENQKGKCITNERHTCILCREEQEVSITGRCLVLSAFIQRSTVLSKNRERKLGSDDDNMNPLFVTSDLNFGPHISTCGHVMHADCWQNFFDSVLAKERRRPIRYGRHVSFDVDKHEFLCPLCVCLSNSVIPIIPAIDNEVKNKTKKSDISLTNWLIGLHAIVEKDILFCTESSINENSDEKYIYRILPHLKDILANVPNEFKEYLENLFDEYQDNVVKNEELSQSLLDVMKHFAQDVYTTSLLVNPNSEDERISLMIYWSCSYTLQSIERMLRLEEKTIFADLSSRKYNCLKALVRYIGSSIAVFNGPIMKSHCIKIMRYLLVNDCHITNNNCCLDLDALSLLISLVITTPSLFLLDTDSQCNNKLYSMSLGNVSDKHYINLMIVFNIVQIILTQSPDNYTEEPMEVEEFDTSSTGQSVNRTIQSFYSEIMIASGQSNYKVPNVLQIELFLKTNLLPFLRSVALFFHFLTNVSPPQKFKDNSNQSVTPVEEFDILCHYLGLSSKFSVLLESTSLRQLALIWARHPRVNVIINEKSDLDSLLEFKPKLIVQPHSLNYLVRLPNDYSDLINSVSQFTCPNSDGNDSRSPTMCLICGTILCSHSYCCQNDLEGTMVGSCTWHSHFCGAGQGMFLRIRDCKILLLAGKTKGCYLAPPYIDEYGETDQGLIRGNPLHLCESSYAKLHKIWLRHGIPEQIAHALETSSNLAAFNWQLL